MYLAFDLDSTLGDFTGVWQVLNVLHQQTFYFDKEHVVPFPSSQFEEKINKAYNTFVRLVAQAETSKDAVGLFRPGIFEVFKEVISLKKKGECVGVIIYSNNGCKAILDFVRDVFHYIFDYKIFDDVIHFHHMLRLKESPTASDVRKNWIELKRILVEGKCQASSKLEVSDVMFFDDQIHADLFIRLGKKYIKVSSYETTPNMEAIVVLYKNALKTAGLLEDSEFLPFIRKTSRVDYTSLPEYFDKVAFSEETSVKKGKRDPGIRLMTRALKTLHKKRPTAKKNTLSRKASQKGGRTLSSRL